MTVQTNQRYLEFIKSESLVSPKAKVINSVIIPPCYVGDDAVIENSVIGPYVSVGEKTRIIDSRIKNSIIQTESVVSRAMLDNSMLGNFATFEGSSQDLSLGDYNALKGT